MIQVFSQKILDTLQLRLFVFFLSTFRIHIFFAVADFTMTIKVVSLQFALTAPAKTRANETKLLSFGHVTASSTDNYDNMHPGVITIT